MPEYFFDVNGKGVTDSQEAEVLADDQVAWHEATLVAGELFKDVDGKLRSGQGWKLDVLNGQREPVFSIYVTLKNWSGDAMV